MIYILVALLAVAIAVALYYKDRARYFESLFELSKGDEKSGWDNLPKISHNVGSEYDIMFHSDVQVPVGTKLRMTRVTADTGIVTAKYNKDGSIAKKRGPKPKR